MRAAIADTVTSDTRRQDLLLEYATALGPDPAFHDLDDAELAHAVRVGAAEIAAATGRWLQHLAELVVRRVWAVDGARTPAAWLSWALGMAPSTAREHVRVALRLRECPLVRERLTAGRLSYSKARAITRVATPETEEMLLRWADEAPAHVIERIIADTRRQQLATDAPEDRSDLGLVRRWRDDGTYELVLRADAGTGLAIDQHLDRLLELDDPDLDEPGDDGHDAMPEPAPDERHGGRVHRPVRAAELVAGALAAAVERAPDDTSGGDRHHVVVHVSASDLLGAAPGASASAEAPSPPRHDATTGTPRLVRDGRNRTRVMSARTLWRLACSARLDVAVSSDDGHPADLGRARRLPDARLRRLLHARDRSCRFPGCGATLFLHAHHVVHWEDGGATDLDNLLLLCNHHHTVVHGGWELRPAGRGRWTFHRPEGRGEALPTAAALTGASAEAVAAAARAHLHDLGPDARQRLLQPTGWDGDYDHDMTLGVLAERLATAA